MPQEFASPLSQHRNEKLPKHPVFAPQAVAVMAEELAPETTLFFEVGTDEFGEEVIGRQYKQSEWDQVLNLNPGKQPGADAWGSIGLRTKEMMTRPVGGICSEGDLNGASSDLKGLEVGDIAAVLRSDGTWRYAKLKQIDGPPEEELVAQASSSVISSFTVAFIGLFVSGGVAFAMLGFYRSALTPFNSPLLSV